MYQLCGTKIPFSGIKGSRSRGKTGQRTASICSGLAMTEENLDNLAVSKLK